MHQVFPPVFRPRFEPYTRAARDPVMVRRDPSDRSRSFSNRRARQRLRSPRPRLPALQHPSPALPPPSSREEHLRQLPLEHGLVAARTRCPRATLPRLEQLQPARVAPRVPALGLERLPRRVAAHDATRRRACHRHRWTRRDGRVRETGAGAALPETCAAREDRAGEPAAAAAPLAPVERLAVSLAVTILARAFRSAQSRRARAKRRDVFLVHVPVLGGYERAEERVETVGIVLRAKCSRRRLEDAADVRLTRAKFAEGAGEVVVRLFTQLRARAPRTRRSAPRPKLCRRGRR